MGTSLTWRQQPCYFRAIFSFSSASNLQTSAFSKLFQRINLPIVTGLSINNPPFMRSPSQIANSKWGGVPIMSILELAVRPNCLSDYRAFTIVFFEFMFLCLSWGGGSMLKAFLRCLASVSVVCWLTIWDCSCWTASARDLIDRGGYLMLQFRKSCS